MKRGALSSLWPGRRVVGEDVVAASWGDASSSETGSIWEEPQSPGTQVTINMIRSPHRVAPEGVFFTLSLRGFDTNTLPAGRYDPSYHDKYVFWDYAEAYAFTAPVQVLAMDAADGNGRANARYSRGPLGSHVFRAPGIYTVRVAVLEPNSGKIGFGRVEVNVGNPDTFYARAATLFVDTTRAYTNAPAQARRFSTIDDALEALAAALTPHRVVLERGQVHTMTRPFNYRPPRRASGLSLRIEARTGRGPKPLVMAGPGIRAGSNLIFDNSLREISRPIGTGVVIQGVEFQGPWDVRTARGRKIDCIEFNGARGSGHVVIDACDFSGWGQTFFPNSFEGRTPEKALFFNDVTLKSWAGIGFFGGADSVLSFTGCGFVQDRDAITRQTMDNTTLGPLRISSSRMCNIWACDFFSSTGWSVYRSITALQPAVRWNSAPSVLGAMANIQASVFESGRIALELKPQNPKTARKLVNVLFESNVAIAGFQGDAVIHSAFGGMTYRNNICVFAGDKNSARIGGQGQVIHGFIRFTGGGQGDLLNEKTPVSIYNNTFANLTAVRPRGLIGDSIGMSDVIERNNLLHQPEIGQPYTGLEATQVFTPRYKGYRPDAATLYDAYATPADGGSFWVPQIGMDTELASPAIGAALREPSSSLDFQGDRRPEPPSIGALEGE